MAGQGPNYHAHPYITFDVTGVMQTNEVSMDVCQTNKAIDNID